MTTHVELGRIVVGQKNLRGSVLVMSDETQRERRTQTEQLRRTKSNWFRPPDSFEDVYGENADESRHEFIPEVEKKAENSDDNLVKRKPPVKEKPAPPPSSSKPPPPPSIFKESPPSPETSPPEAAPADSATANNFSCFWVSKDDKKFIKEVRQISDQNLPGADTLIRVHYSSLNYKDALSAKGHPGVTKDYPHIPGIDAAGIIEEGGTEEMPPGTEVIVTGFDMGMNYYGGFSQYIRVPWQWCVPLPENLSLRESMVLGTAGFTAGLAINELIKNNVYGGTEVLVTGATGGVGSLSVAMLKQAGYKVCAATMKNDSRQFLKDLGADHIVNTGRLADQDDDKALHTEHYPAAIDCLGGKYLVNILKAAKLNATIITCGLVSSPDLHINVYPFILRGVRLIGIDSQHAPVDQRPDIWNVLSTTWKPKGLNGMAKDCTLDTLAEEMEIMLQGGQHGRVVVDLR